MASLCNETLLRPSHQNLLNLHLCRIEETEAHEPGTLLDILNF